MLTPKERNEIYNKGYDSYCKNSGEFKSPYLDEHSVEYKIFQGGYQDSLTDALEEDNKDEDYNEEDDDFDDEDGEDGFEDDEDEYEDEDSSDLQPT